jgi:hypothetical protein
MREIQGFLNSLHKEALNKLWLCRQCNVRFIFFSDVEDHMQITGHAQVIEFDLITGQVVNN